MNITSRALLAASLALGAVTAQAALINGGFETGTLAGWSSTANTTASGSVAYGVGTVNPFGGTTAARLRSNGGPTAAGLAGLMGTTEAALEASNGGVNATQGALLWQSSAASVGDTFTFRWNFVEQDYIPFDDWAFYGISINGGPATITKFASLATVGPTGGSTINGWSTLNINITQSGNYTFFFGIVDALDTALPSDLWIDGVGGTGTVGGTVPTPGGLALAGLGLLGLGFARRRS